MLVSSIVSLPETESRKSIFFSINWAQNLLLFLKVSFTLWKFHSSSFRSLNLINDKRHRRPGELSDFRSTLNFQGLEKSFLLSSTQVKHTFMISKVIQCHRNPTKKERRHLRPLPARQNIRINLGLLRDKHQSYTPTDRHHKLPGGYERTKWPALKITGPKLTLK